MTPQELGSAAASEMPTPLREAWRKDAAETLRLVAFGCEGMADALDSDDGILGAMNGMVLANHLPALPKHIRDVFMEYLSDEEAAGLRSERLYMDAMYPEPLAAAPSDELRGE